MSVDTREMRSIALYLATSTSYGQGAARVLEAAADELDAMRRQFPAEMPGCTIVFKKCEHGHGRLVGTNWVDPGCIACERDALRAQVRMGEHRLAKQVERTQLFRDRAEVCDLPESAFPDTPRCDPVCDCMPHDGPEGCHTLACATITTMTEWMDQRIK